MRLFISFGMKPSCNKQGCDLWQRSPHKSQPQKKTNCYCEPSEETHTATTLSNFV